MKSWIRWVLILPAAIGALFGITAIYSIFLEVYVNIGFGKWGALFISIIYLFVGPAYFVKAGAKVAPKYSFYTSVVLAIVLFIYGELFMNKQHETNSVILLTIVSLSGLFYACYTVYKAEKKQASGEQSAEM